MVELAQTNHLAKEAILAELITILEDMSGDWEMGFGQSIGPETLLLADLGFESINFVRLAEAIQRQFKKRNLPFHELLMSDPPLDDLKVSALAEFVFTHLST